MSNINNVELTCSKDDATEWNVRVKGEIEFDDTESGSYRLEIKLFPEDFPNVPWLKNPPPVYTFLFPAGTSPIFLGVRSYKTITANSGQSMTFDETRRIDRETLDEDPGVTWTAISLPPYRLPVPDKDEIYAVVTVSKVSSSRSSTQVITA